MTRVLPPNLGKPHAEKSVAVALEMGSPPAVDWGMYVFTALVLARDALSSAEIRRCIEHAFPGSENLFPRTLAEAGRALAARRTDLLVADVDFPGGDIVDFIFECVARRRRSLRMLVMAECGAPRALVSLQSLKVAAVFDPVSQPPEQFAEEVARVGGGGRGWTENFLKVLHGDAARVVRHQLTPREQLGLAVIGEGCGDAAAAGRLGMRLSSVRSMRREIYAKLDVHGTDELVCRSRELGFTRFTRSGPRALGLQLLIEEYRTRSKRSLPASIFPAPCSAAAA